MMRSRLQKRLLLLLPLLLAAGWTACAAMGIHPHEHRETREKIMALEEQWRKAQLSGDVSALDHLMSEDYLGITLSGQVVTKAQQLERVRSHTLIVRSLETLDTKIKIIGNHAVVVVSLVSVEGTANGRPIHGKFRYSRVYSRQPGGPWKVTNFEITPARGPLADLDGE